MKFTIVLFAFIGLLTAVAALPFSDIGARDGVTDQALEQRFFDEDDSISVRYFGESHEIAERDYADEAVEPRQIAKAAEFVIKGIVKIVELIKGQIEADKKKRGKWTNHMIGEFRKKFPRRNFVICASKHKTDFKGIRGKDWGHSHQELPVSFHKTVGFEIYWFTEGTFYLQGDGGWMNWAYSGAVKSTSNGGKTLVFGPP